MGQTLTHGVYLPDEGERNCYSGLAANWQILDTSVGTIAEHTTQIAGKANAVHTHVKADITDFPVYGTTAGTICEGNDSRLSDARTPVAHTHLSADVTDLLNSAHTWIGDNTYTKYQNIVINGTEIGVAPTVQNRNGLLFKDKNGVNIGWLRYQYDTSGDVSIEMLVSNKYKNGALDPTVTQVYQGVKQTITSTGASYFSWSGYVNNSLYPYTTETFNIGDSTHQWNNLYAKNYYYNGVAWGLDKANTWTNTNAFNILSLYNNSVTYNEAPSSNIELPSIRVFGGGRYCGAFDYLWKSTGENVIRLSLGSYKSDGSFGYWACNFGVPRDFSDGGKFGTPAFYPNTGGYNLGDSTHKWKTLNGCNPGTLSLPDYNNVLDVTSEVPTTSLDGNTQININDYLADKTGWLSIVIDDTAGNSIIVTQGKSGGATAFNNSRTFHTGAQSNGYISVFFPIIADTSKIAFIKASSLIQMRFYYCLGNV